MNIVILLDNPTQLNPKKDTTLYLIEEAQKTGIRCSILTHDTMVCDGNTVSALVSDIHVNGENISNFVTLTNTRRENLNQYDVLLMRKDPPFNMAYIYITYMLDLLVNQGVRVFNHPQSLRDCNEKCFALHFADCIPETIVTVDKASLIDFHRQHQDVIFKPLDGMGGQGIFHVDKSAHNLDVILSMLTQDGQLPIMAQKYIPEIMTSGDKRILIVGGEPVPYALARFPKKGEHRGNLAAGGTGKVVPLTERDCEIVKRISPVLVEKQLMFVGIDVIGDYLTEVNVTSPTCAREISSETNINIAEMFFNILRKK